MCVCEKERGRQRACPACLRVSRLGATFKVSGVRLGLSPVFRVHGAWFMVQDASFRALGSGLFRQGRRVSRLPVQTAVVEGIGKGHPQLSDGVTLNCLARPFEPRQSGLAAGEGGHSQWQW